MTDEITKLISQVAENRVKLNTIDIGLAAVQANRTKLEAELEVLEAAIADEQKLENGGYGTFVSPMGVTGSFLIVDSHRGIRVKYSTNSNPDDDLKWFKRECSYVLYGNIFDDLKAIQEDVTMRDDLRMKHEDSDNGTQEFGIGLALDGKVFISVEDDEGNRVFHCDLPELEQVALRMRRLLATLKRRQK